MEAEIENGTAKVPKGEWLAGLAQPVAAEVRFTVAGLKGLVVPDRQYVRRVTTAGARDRREAAADEKAGALYFASAECPFLTRMEALPDEPLMVVSAKVLVAPAGSRIGAKRLTPIPMTRKHSFAYTIFQFGWVVAATKSRVTRIAVQEGETLSVRPEALVAWSGKTPTGFCPKLGLMDLILPRGPRNLMLDFHGPAVVWFEGAAEKATGNLRRFRGR